MATVGKRAFTLIELLTVLAIAALLMGIAIVGFRDLGRGRGIRAAVASVRSGLALARQYTITNRQKTTFAYGNLANQGYYYLSNDLHGVIGNTNYLPEGISFGAGGATNSFQTIRFKLDGSADASWFKKDITLRETLAGSNRLERALEVHRLTGRVRYIDEKF